MKKIIKTFESFNNKNIIAEIIQHVMNNNPHEGERDARWGVQESVLNEYEWSFEVIQPNDSRIVNLYPASKRDVKKYMKLYQKGSDFPAVVLFLQHGGYDDKNKKVIDEHFVVADGQHRLQAAVNLEVPIKAYIGKRKELNEFLKTTLNYNRANKHKLFEDYKNYEFAYTCVAPSNDEELEAIIDHIGSQEEISQENFLKLIPFEEINQVLPVVYKNEQQFINDWHAKCYIGSFYFDGEEEWNKEEKGEEYDITQYGELINYAVIVHSAIEHVWKA